MEGGGGRDKDEKGTRYRKELTCTCMHGIAMKSNGIICWDSFAGCVYGRHLDFKHHTVESESCLFKESTNRFITKHSQARFAV